MLLSYKFRSFVVTVGTQPIPIAQYKIETTNGFLIKRLRGQVGIVYLGGSDVTTANGYPLDDGQEVHIPIDDCSKIFAVSNMEGRSIRVLCL